MVVSVLRVVVTTDEVVTGTLVVSAEIVVDSVSGVFAVVVSLVVGTVVDFSVVAFVVNI